MAAPILINHRRNRQQARRILAQIVVRGRDLTGSYFPEDFDLFDRQRQHAVNNNNRQDVVAEGDRT